MDSLYNWIVWIRIHTTNRQLRESHDDSVTRCLLKAMDDHQRSARHG